MIEQRLCWVVACATMVAMSLAAGVHADEPPGVLWATTSQMSMPGMPMSPPPQTVNVCTPKVWTKPPPGGDASCTNTNYQQIGNRVAWDMQCTDQMQLTGHGEITFEGTDTYSGAIDATAEGVAVTIKLSGQKLGTCDTPIE